MAYAAKLIHDAVANVNNYYFESFIDFATHEAKKDQDLVPMGMSPGMNKFVLCPELEVDSWLKFPFYDLDFGGGRPYILLPSYLPAEGSMILLPSFIGDGSIDAFIPLFHDHLATFKKIVYSLDY